MLSAGTFRSICLYDFAGRTFTGRELGHVVASQRAPLVRESDSFFVNGKIKTVFTNIVLPILWRSTPKAFRVTQEQGHVSPCLNMLFSKIF